MSPCLVVNSLDLPTRTAPLDSADGDLSAELRTSFIGHSCIQIRWGEINLLCDPWLSGTVFNNSWELQPPPDLTRVDLEGLTHLWISHEHPDHFHLPSLEWIADQVDASTVTVLTQQWNSGKIFDALATLGFRKFQPMTHMKPIALAPGFEAVVYAHKQLDSALGVLIDGEAQLLNINDTELSPSDRSALRTAFGPFPLLFNQFSIGGYDGHPDDERIEAMAAHMLEKLVVDHRALGADITVPFASFVRFNRPDNAHLNAFHNTALEAVDHLESHGCAARVLRSTSPAMSFAEIKRSDDRGWYEEWYRHSDEALAPVESVSFDECQRAFAERTAEWKRRTNRFAYRRLEPISVWLGDLEQAAVMNFATCTLVAEPDGVTPDSAQLVINSQPLWFAFTTPFGLQTLGVSGRYRFNRYPPSWRWVRLISSLANADIHLGFRSLLRPEFLRMVAGRAASLPGQIRQQVARVTPTGSVPV